MNENTPKKNKTVPHPLLTMEQAQQLLDSARERSRDLEALLFLAMASGMRRGELLGLKWSDIDFDQGTLQVQRALHHNCGQHEYVETVPKTESDRRQLDLPASVVASLQQQQMRQQDQRRRAGVTWQEHGYVFTDQNGEPQHPLWLLKQFMWVRTAAGLPDVSFHSLRRSARQLIFQ